MITTLSSAYAVFNVIISQFMVHKIKVYISLIIYIQTSTIKVLFRFLSVQVNLFLAGPQQGSVKSRIFSGQEFENLGSSSYHEKREYN